MILTPLKPPTKSNISSEAVNASLYYLHVASEADEDVLRSMGSENELQLQQSPHDGHMSGLPTETVSRLNDFHRKPVGGAAESQPPPPPPHRELPPSSPVIPRKPTAAADESGSPTIPYPHGEDRIQMPGYNHQGPPPPGRNEDPNHFTIPRRPAPSGAAPGPSPTIHAPAQADYSHNYSREERPRINTENEYPAQEWRQSLHATEKVPSPVTPTHKSSSFKITIIRRDPASGHQWNVGTMSSLDDKGSIHVEITNPGYGKFLNNESFSLAAVGQNLPAAGHVENAAAEAIKAMMHSAPRNDEPDTVFRREVVPVKHNQPQSNHQRSGSADSRIADMANPKASRGYYSFTSPWNGNCAFVASINGLGIKCKHTIPGPSMSGPQESNNNAEVTVSELRFNIPFPLDQHFRSPLLSVWGEKGGKRGALAQMITSNIQKVQQARTRARSESNPIRPPSGSSSEDLTADEDRLDLSLAREPGGGGMSGRSAKLGKLIIEDEGIKMIDLVVAASMGVWWRSCHRTP